MNVSCPDCRSIFRVDPAKVPPNGVRARCSVCSGVISIPAPTGHSTPSSGSNLTPGAPTGSAIPTARSTPTPRSTWNEGIFSSPPPRETAAPTPPRSAPAGGAASASPEGSLNPRQRPEGAERTTASATATPPSPTSGLPEFTPPPIAPPFRPSGLPQTPSAGAFSTPTAQPFVPPSPRASTPARPTSTPSAASPFGSSPTPVAGIPSAGGESGVRRPLNPFLSKDPNQRAKRLARALVSDIITYHPAKHAEGLRDGTLKQLFREEIKKSFEEYIAQVGQQLAESTTYFQEALNEVLGAGKKIF
jgi:predicted Zn finger-like uncharacterized protein